MDDHLSQPLQSPSGRIVRRQPTGYSSKGDDIVPTSKRLASNHEPEDNTDTVDPEEIERIIRERRQRFDQTRLKNRKDKNRLADEQSNKSRRSSSRQDFQVKRAKKKGQLMQRISILQGRIDKDQKADQKIRIRDIEESDSSEPRSPSQPVQKVEQTRVPDRLTSETFKQILQDMRMRHHQEILSLTRHNEMKVRSLESMLRSKDSIIRQLELQATRTREYIQQLQKTMSNSP